MLLRDLNQTDSTLIGDIISHSFADDPVNEWIFKSRQAMNGYYTRSADALYLKKGFGHVSHNHQGGSLWLPPGQSKSLAWHHSASIGLSMLRRCGFQGLVRGILLDEGLLKHKPTEPHFYLFAIGTRPNSQRQGIGGQLMRAGLEKVDAANMPAYLESSKEINVPFYQRFGFEITKKLSPTKNSPPLWLMWRE